jgi:hypothetical protein
LCVFVRESLPLEQVSSLGDDKQPSFVENAVVNALSSVVVPHTTRTQSLISTLKEENAHVVPIQELDVSHHKNTRSIQTRSLLTFTIGFLCF